MIREYQTTDEQFVSINLEAVILAEDGRHGRTFVIMNGRPLTLRIDYADFVWEWKKYRHANDEWEQR